MILVDRGSVPPVPCICLFSTVIPIFSASFSLLYSDGIDLKYTDKSVGSFSILQDKLMKRDNKIRATVRTKKLDQRWFSILEWNAHFCTANFFC